MSLEFEPKQKAGEGEDPAVYKKPDEKRGCDKPDHFARSTANQPNHAKHHEKGYKQVYDASYEGYDDHLVGS